MLVCTVNVHNSCTFVGNWIKIIKKYKKLKKSWVLVNIVICSLGLVTSCSHLKDHYEEQQVAFHLLFCPQNCPTTDSKMRLAQILFF